MRFLVFEEKPMLSPHEVAALILVGSATDHHDLSHADLEALLERRLATSTAEILNCAGKAIAEVDLSVVCLPCI